MATVGNPEQVRLAQERRDAALKEARREGFDAGRAEERRASEERYDVALKAIHAERDLREKEIDRRAMAAASESRKAGYWFGAAKFGIAGVVIGAIMALTITNAVQLAAFEAATEATASGAVIGAMRESAGLPAEPQ